MIGDLDVSPGIRTDFLEGCRDLPPKVRCAAGLALDESPEELLLRPLETEKQGLKLPAERPVREQKA